MLPSPLQFTTKLKVSLIAVIMLFYYLEQLCHLSRCNNILHCAGRWSMSRPERPTETEDSAACSVRLQQ